MFNHVLNADLPPGPTFRRRKWCRSSNSISLFEGSCTDPKFI